MPCYGKGLFSLYFTSPSNKICALISRYVTPPTDLTMLLRLVALPLTKVFNTHRNVQRCDIFFVVACKQSICRPHFVRSSLLCFLTALMSTPSVTGLFSFLKVVWQKQFQKLSWLCARMRQYFTNIMFLIVVWAQTTLALVACKVRLLTQAVLLGIIANSCCDFTVAYSLKRDLPALLVLKLYKYFFPSIHY